MKAHLLWAAVILILATLVVILFGTEEQGKLAVNFVGALVGMGIIIGFFLELAFHD